jgi:2-methylcitrate dehydratase PrpD
LVAGVDIIVRLGLSVNQNPNVSGISSTWQMGVFGACAAAGRLMGLNAEQMRNALGIAYCQTSGNQQAIIEGTLMVRVMQGVTARTGLMAAILAKQGIDGPKEAFQGKFGYFPVFHQDRYNPAVITRDLGKTFEIANSSLKPFPCCKAIHPAISCVKKIQSEHGVSPEEIEQIIVGINQSTYNLVCHPIESKRRPSTITESQFSLPYCLGVAIRKGDVFLDDFSPEAIQNEEVLNSAEKVSVFVDEAIERRAGRHIGPAKVEITTKSHETLKADAEFVKGHPLNPMTMDEVEEKFKKCAGFAAGSIPPENLSEVCRIIGGLETCPDVSQIVELLK